MTPAPAAQLPTDLAWLARLLDSRFRLPGTRLRFGLDAVVGLLPGIGDSAMAVLSLYIVFRAGQAGASPPTLARMLGNVGLDWLIGCIPLAGDLFDVAWKANLRNLDLLAAESRPVARPPATGA